MNKEKKSYKDKIYEATKGISNMKSNLLETIREMLSDKTDEEHTFIELNSPVTIAFVNANNIVEIKRIYRDGGLVEINSYGIESNDETIDDLNVSQLYDLMIQIDENDDFDDEVA